MTTHETDLLDPFTALQRAGDLTAPEDRPDEAVVTARTAVRRAATTATLQQKVTRVRRSRLRMALAATGIAAATVVGGVAITGGGSDGSPLLGPAAAVVLEQAADVARAEPGHEVGAGQFLRITLLEEFADDGGTSVERRTIWVPHDVDAAWIFRVAGEVWREPSWADDEADNHLLTYDPDWYASLSDDPAVMMTQIRDAIGGEGEGGGYDFWEIQSEVLRSGLAPAQVRAALFEELAETEGMTVTTGVALPGGGTGTALEVIDSADGRQMLFDEGGAYVGERASDYGARVAVTVVDGLPGPVRRAAAATETE